MASISKDHNGTRRILFVGADGNRKSIYLGTMPMKAVQEIRCRIEHLAAAKAARSPLDEVTARWVAGISEDLAGKLAAVGLIDKRGSATVDAFVAKYIDGRTDNPAPALTSKRHAGGWWNTLGRTAR